MATAANTDSTEYIRHGIIISDVLFTALEIICTGLRFWARSLTARVYDFDDWLVVASVLDQFIAGETAIGEYLCKGSTWVS